jgi:hypothetical protein
MFRILADLDPAPDPQHCFPIALTIVQRYATWRWTTIFKYILDYFWSVFEFYLFGFSISNN